MEITVSSIRIKYAELGEEGKPGRGNRRFNCPIHGGDSYSLSIPDEGEKIGMGHCHNGRCEGNRLPVIVLDYPGRTNNKSSQPQDKNARIKALLTPRDPVIAPPLDAHAISEIATLQNWQPRMAKAIHTTKAAAYLASRGISLEIAEAAHVGYIPDVSITPYDKWRDRLIFPLWHPAGIGYTGRSLHGWVEGMTSDEHKALLPDGMRWQKTGRAGWYGVAAHELASTIILVEGALDRLALLAQGADDNEVIALGGTMLNLDWIPTQVLRVILALDLDEAGRTASAKRKHYLETIGLEVIIADSDDMIGKDASERHQNDKIGLWYIFTAWDTVTGIVARPSDIVDVQIRPAAHDTIEPTPLEPYIAPVERAITITTNCYSCTAHQTAFTVHDVQGDKAICRNCNSERTISAIPDYANMPIICKAPALDATQPHYTPPFMQQRKESKTTLWCTHCHETTPRYWSSPHNVLPYTGQGGWACERCHELAAIEIAIPIL